MAESSSTPESAAPPPPAGAETPQPQVQPTPETPQTTPQAVGPENTQPPPDAPEPQQDQTADAATANSPENNADTDKQKVERAIEVAEVVLQKKHGEIVENIKGRDATNEEADLLMVGNYARGFDHHDFTAGSMPVDGLVVKTTDGKDIKVTGLTAQKRNQDGSVSYAYEGKNADGTDADPDEVSGFDMAQAQLTQRKDGILKNFTNENEKKLIAWQADGAKQDDIPLTDDELTALAPAEEASPETKGVTEIDKAFDARVGELQAKISELGAIEHKTEEQQKELVAAKRVIDLINSVKALPEGPIAVMGRESVIKQVLAHGEGELGSFALRKLGREQEGIAQVKGKAIEDFVKKLEAANVDKAQIESALQVLEDPQLLEEFLNINTDNEAVKKLKQESAISEALLGANSQEAIDNLDAFAAASEAIITDEAKKQKLALARKLLKGGGMTVGGLSLLILALTGATMTIAAQGIAGQRRAA